MALAAKFYSDITAQDTVTGTGDTIAVTTPTLYAALVPIRLLFTASAANTGAATLNLDGLGAKAVRKISGGTDVALVAGDIPGAGARVDVVYSAAANSAAGGWIILGSAATPFATNAQAATATSAAVALTPANLAQERGYSNASFINLSLVASVGSSALTVAIKGVDGNDPSAANPVYISFRSVTAGSGATSQLALTAATSIVISSGSTMGFTSAVIGRLWLVGFNDAGTFRLGLVNALSGTSIMALADGIYSSTAEGGAGGADSAQVIYTGTAVTSKAMTVLGYLEATEATAGTWATAPSLIQIRTPATPLPGTALQSPRLETSATNSGTTVVPLDDTIPQSGEGVLFMTAPTITPISAANLYDVTALGQYSNGVANNIIQSLFQDSTANALATSVMKLSTGTDMVSVFLRKRLQVTSTSATVFKIRTGGNAAGTTYFNGSSGGRLFGGVLDSYIEVQEIMA